MTRRPEFWELAAWGAAVGGAAVWGLAAAARVGWLRALLDLYPKSSWDRVTWVLIPVLLILPFIAQGIGVAWASPSRPIPVGRGIAGSVAGSVLALVAGAVLFIGVRRVPALAGGPAARALPVLLILGYAVLLFAGWLLSASRALRSRRLRMTAVPLTLAVAAALWIFAREWILLASYVLDRAEVAAFFLVVAVGGAVGAARSLRPRDPPNLSTHK